MKNTMMTTLVIAHRLSTIRNADMIAVVDNGKVVESGTHDELVAMKSHYFRLVEAQKRKPSETVDSSPSSSEHDSQREVDMSAPDNHTTTNNAVIEFEDVHFEYPARPDAPVFRGLNLKVRQGETLALVGPSGCGKSTVIQLMECFYRPTLGTVKYHGVDMKDLNVRWLRDQLGLVSQQPVLFDCSIEENIRYSLPDASREQVVEAAKQANAHDFIMGFPEQYQTSVGQGSTLVSGGKRACSKILVPGGSPILCCCTSRVEFSHIPLLLPPLYLPLRTGQKQRICIARALVKKPKVRRPVLTLCLKTVRFFFVCLAHPALTRHCVLAIDLTPCFCRCCYWMVRLFVVCALIVEKKTFLLHLTALY